MTSETTVNKQPLISIRELKPADIDSILELEQAIFEDPWPREMFDDYLDDPEVDFLIAAQGSEIVGYAVLEMADDHGHLTNIAVAGNWRRKSVAKRLMNRIFEIVSASGREIVVLEVRPSSSEALKLYERYGFREMYRKPNYYRRPVEEAIIMAAYPEPRTTRN